MAADFVESFEAVISDAWSQEANNQNAVLTYMTMLDDQKTMNQFDIKEWNRLEQFLFKFFLPFLDEKASNKDTSEKFKEVLKKAVKDTFSDNFINDNLNW